MLYVLLKWAHVLAAIAAVGANLTFGVWTYRASRHPEALPFTLRGIQLLDDRLATPAYVLLLATGLPMVFVARTAFATPWLLAALVLYGGIVALGVFGYTPTLRRQIDALDAEGPASPAYLALARRSVALGAVLTLIAVAITFLMVVKPALWA